jgi:hypothetical protein
MTDRLMLVNALEDAGIDRRKAENVATVVFEAIRGDVVTKAELALAVRDLKLWTGGVVFAAFTLQVAAIGLLIRFLPAAH